MHRIEGYVIVSADGMIADALGVMPASIRNDADQAFFQAGLDAAAGRLRNRSSYRALLRARWGVAYPAPRHDLMHQEC